MHFYEYACHDGLGLADLIQRKELTAHEVALLALEGFQKINPEINAVIDVYYDRIDRVEPLIQSNRPFSGVPFLLKDLGATDAGRLQEMGSRLTRGYLPTKDALLTSRFKEAGLSIIGRTTTPEFGFAATTESVLTGATRNPWNLDLMAGGSSGGAAAAVAAGIVPLAHASDGGGSIRIPASCCGVVGLKPSRGRVSCSPDQDERKFGLVQEFVVSRNVRDTAAMLDLVSQPAIGDPYIITQPQETFLEELGTPSRELKIGLISESWTGAVVDPEIIDGVSNVAHICEEMGHQVEEATLRFNLEPYYQALSVMWNSALRFTCDQLAMQMNRSVDSHQLESVTFEIYKQAGHIAVADIFFAKEFLNTIRRKVCEQMKPYDLLLTPTMAQLPAPIGTTHQNLDIPLEEWYSRLAPFNAFTSLFNVTGLPAISLPLCQSMAGLPIGMQFVAGFGQEALLLKLAAVFEKAMPWKDRLPPM